MSVEIKGADQLARLSKQLRDAGAKDLQRELAQGINRALKPMKEDIRQSALDSLPKRGGFAAAIAGSKLRTRRRTGRVAGVRVVAENRFSLYHPDRGEVRHRVKGKPAAQWPVQRIQPGWWTRPTEGSAPAVRKELLAALDAVAKKLHA